MQTVVSVTRQDSGSAARLAVGDELRVTLPESEATAGWKAEVEGTALVAAEAAPGGPGQYWDIGDQSQGSVHTFRAVEEGPAVVKMTYQGMGSAGIQVLDTFTLEVTVGDAPEPKARRERLPLPEMALVMIQFFLAGAAGVFISVLLGLSGASADDDVEMFIGLLGCVLFGTICIVVLLRFAKMAILRRLR